MKKLQVKLGNRRGFGNIIDPENVIQSNHEKERDNKGKESKETIETQKPLSR